MKKRRLPSAAEVKAEVNRLIDMKPSVRHYSAFGDDHHAAIEAQVAVLHGRMGNDAIFDEYEDGSENVLNAALDAMRWRDDGDERPSDQWKDLVTNL